MNIDQRLRVLERRLEAMVKRRKPHKTQTRRVFSEIRDAFNHPTFRSTCRAAQAHWVKRRALAKEITEGTKELLRVAKNIQHVCAKMYP
jgi:hypothetical protein